MQAERKTRDKKMRAASKKPKGPVPEPYILSYSRGPVEGGMPDKVAAWVEAENKAQMRHYRRIYREVESLAPLRDGWVKEFFKRISGPRGFSVHAGTRRTIPKDEIPRRPRRPWRVIW